MTEQATNITVGDLASTARGSGARANGGKPPLDLLPLHLLASVMDPSVHDQSACSWMAALGAIQSRKCKASQFFRSANYGTPSVFSLLQAAQVFEYGRAKYAAWNWAKGMPWSVPLACAARHLLKIAEGEELDAESGLSHWGHFYCNLIMLATYETTYPEGDDLPPAGSLA